MSEVLEQLKAKVAEWGQERATSEAATRSAVEATGVFDPSAIEVPATPETIRQGGLYSLRRGTPPATPESVISPGGTVRVPGTPTILPKTETLNFLRQEQKPPSGPDEAARLEQRYLHILTAANREAAKRTNLKFGGEAIRVEPGGAVVIGAKGSQEASDFFDAQLDATTLKLLQTDPRLLERYGAMHTPPSVMPAEPTPVAAPPPPEPSFMERLGGAVKSFLPRAATPSQAAPPPAVGQGLMTLPDPATHQGRIITVNKAVGQYHPGDRLTSDGTKWILMPRKK